jgi:ABC-type molybdate transport system substrate-binding protein
MDDILRGPMPVSGLRKFTDSDCFALINIQEKKAVDFFRSAETPNHKFFENTNKEFTNKYQKFKHQIALISNASSNLKRVIEEGDTNLDSDATSDFFSFVISTGRV